MSIFRGAGRGDVEPPKGVFVNGAWHCDCNPRMPAKHLQVKKEGPTQGSWFHRCPKLRYEQCDFFLWEKDALVREKAAREQAALTNNTHTEPDRTNPITPARPQPSPPPPYTIETRPSGASRKRTRSISGSDDEYGAGQANDDFNGELSQASTQDETPSKARKTTSFATPATARRMLPWQIDQPTAGSAHGLQTPQTAQRASGDPFASRYPVSAGSLFTPSRVNEYQTYQTPTPSSSFETPTPSQNAVTNDLVGDVFDLLQGANVRLGAHIENDLKSMLSKHSKKAQVYNRRYDCMSNTVKAKEARITELTYRVSTLAAELEAEKAMVKQLQWEAEEESALDA